jgi:ribulose-phosphate 3-epimerase
VTRNTLARPSPDIRSRHLRAYVSLWSADLLALRDAVDLIGDDADGLHIDVFDAHHVDELLFGPDVVAALRAHTDAFLDVHLNVAAPEHWARRFIAAGADMITVPVGACPDPRTTLGTIRGLGAGAGLALAVEDPLHAVVPHLEVADRVLVMGTRLGIKGVDLERDAPARVRALADACLALRDPPEIVVDGGIRRHTVPVLATAGADGVVPGSLVFGEPDPVSALSWIRHSRHDDGRTA